MPILVPTNPVVLHHDLGYPFGLSIYARGSKYQVLQPDCPQTLKTQDAQSMASTHSSMPALVSSSDESDYHRREPDGPVELKSSSGTSESNDDWDDIPLVQPLVRLLQDMEAFGKGKGNNGEGQGQGQMQQGKGKWPRR